MRTYRLSDRSCWRSAFKRALFASAVILLGVAAGLLYLASRSALTLHTAWPFGFFALIGFLVIPVGAWRMHAVLGTYRLTLEEDRLTQSLRGANDVTVERGEVTEVVETPGTSLVVTPTTLLVVRTAERRRFIMVFDGLDDYAELRERLSAWREIQVRPRSLLSTALLQAAFVPLFACVFFAQYSSNPYVVIPSALAFAVTMVVLLWLMQRSLHAPPWVKVLSWASLLAVAMMAARIAWVCGLIRK